jgi:hypothetical protein
VSQTGGLTPILTFVLTSRGRLIIVLFEKSQCEVLKMKKLIWLIVILCPLLLSAQEEGVPTEPQNGIGMGGMVGSITIGDQTYSQIRLMPEVTFWKFGLGLDIDLLIDSDGNVRREDWDETRDIINKIYYIRFAQRGEPFYARVGGFPFYTLGHGLIMKDYSNMLLYPNQRNIGAMMGFNLPLPLKPGAEIFTSNVEKNEILAANAHFEPLSISDIPLLSKLSLGVSVVTDRNQYGKYEDSDGDKVPDVLDPNPDLRNYTWDLDGDGINNDVDLDMDGDGVLDSPWVNEYVAETYPALLDSTLAALLDNQIDSLHRYGAKKDIKIFSVDYDLPLIQTKLFTLGHYAEIAKIENYGSGFIFPGFYTKFLIFNANLEFRKFEDKFIPAYFDNLYDDQRSYVVGDTIVTKDMMLDYVKACYGWYGSLEANLFNVIFMRAAYQDMYGEEVQTGKSLWAKVGLDPKIMPKLREASVGYSQTNVPYLSIDKLQTPSAQIDGKLAYGLSDNTFLVGKYSERYVDLDGNGKIKGKDETIKSMTFGVEFQF